MGNWKRVGICDEKLKTSVNNLCYGENAQVFFFINYTYVPKSRF